MGFDAGAVQAALLQASGDGATALELLLSGKAEAAEEELQEALVAGEAAAEVEVGAGAEAVELAATSAAPPPDLAAPPRLWSIGHSTREQAALLALLQRHDIRTLVDVRTVPASARLPHFNADALRRACTARGLAYEHHGHTLGGKNVHGGVEGNLRSEAGASALAALAARAAQGERLALMCAEASWHDCHRKALARELVRRHGCAVLHISEGGCEHHPKPIRLP